MYFKPSTKNTHVKWYNVIIRGNFNVTFPMSDEDVFEKHFLKLEKKLLFFHSRFIRDSRLMYFSPTPFRRQQKAFSGFYFHSGLLSWCMSAAFRSFDLKAHMEKTSLSALQTLFRGETSRFSRRLLKKREVASSTCSSAPLMRTQSTLFCSSPISFLFCWHFSHPLTLTPAY